MNEEFFKHLDTVIEKIYWDYHIPMLKRGRKEGGCGCNSCYIQAKDYYEDNFPMLSEYWSYDELPSALFNKFERDKFIEGLYT